MQWDLGAQGVALLGAISLGFGILAGLVVGGGARDRLVAVVVCTAACFGVGLVTSEGLCGWATEEELQPNVDGLSRDEVLLSSLLTTAVVVLVLRRLGRRSGEPRHQQPALPPRWFVVLFWHGHRALLRVSGGRLGLWRPGPHRWGTLRLTTTGRRTGRPRRGVGGDNEDCGGPVPQAKTGWGGPAPPWWLNLQAHPDAVAQTRDGAVEVRAHRARGEERARLWSRWAELDDDLDAYAARRPSETAVVVLEPLGLPVAHRRR